MLKDGDSRLFELSDQIRRCADVENVVEGKFLAVEFFETFVEVAVEHGGLMRIFAVAQSHRQWKRKRKRCVGCLLLVQEIGNRSIVLRGPVEGFYREALT